MQGPGLDPFDERKKVSEQEFYKCGFLFFSPLFSFKKEKLEPNPGVVNQTAMVSSNSVLIGRNVDHPSCLW
jgi:hypothetical protein